MLRTARAFRNLSLARNLSPRHLQKLTSMTEGSNFDFLFKVRILSATNAKTDS